MAWKKGDVVRLKGSGQEMDVLDVSDTGVLCGWFDKNGKLHKELLPSEALIEAPPPGASIKPGYVIRLPAAEKD